MKDAVILDEKSILRALARIAHEIVERNHGVEDVCLVGVKRRGIPLAQHLAKLIYDFEGVEVPVGELDITWYRDDLSHEDKDPTLNAYNIPFSIQDKVVVIVDDV
ncbi:MAG: phosphoribosyltransferase family protein, partial [Eubacteriales bacterium]|nr:phosphoribosyltransferase family protein [Eubacteriales bacterium]